ncbi:MAG: hypothetical protein RR339_09635, partial [Bacteroidales bacterium]
DKAHGTPNSPLGERPSGKGPKHVNRIVMPRKSYRIPTLSSGEALYSSKQGRGSVEARPWRDRSKAVARLNQGLDKSILVLNI